MNRRLRKYTHRLSGFTHKSVRIPFTHTDLSLAGLGRFFSSQGFMKTALLLFLGFVATTAVLFAYIAHDLPDPNKINSPSIQQTTQILDRNGKLLYAVHGDQNRILIDFSDMPIDCRNAVIVKEDRDFYRHHGVVPSSILRAFKADITAGNTNGPVQGGSTITQQLVKNVLLTPEKTYTRKVKEIVLAVEIEQLYKKDDILKIYLNEIPFGSNAYGLQAAAQTFYGVDSKNLNLEQCATLAAMIQAPTFYSPYGQHVSDLLASKDAIIDEMVKEGYVKKDEGDAAKKVAMTFKPQRENILAPHFVLWVREQLVAKYGEQMVYEGGLKVTTTLDYNLQQLAEQAITENAGNLAKAKAQNAAFVAIDPKTGQVIAMVGSKDYFDQSIDGQVNVALTLQQPGSSGKPYSYATLFSQKDRFGRSWSPGSILYDVSTNFGTFGGKPYMPNNGDGHDLHTTPGSPTGALTIRQALGSSLNIPAVKGLYIAGIDNVINTMHNFGISSPGVNSSNCGLSLVLGGCDVTLLDHTSGYATFASMGIHHDLASVLKIEDSKGKIIAEYKDNSKRVMDPQVTYLIADILNDPNARKLTFGCCPKFFEIAGHPNFAGKTGTSNEDVKNRAVDTWAMGFNPNIAIGIWTGNNDNSFTTGTSITAAEPIWHTFLDKYFATGQPDPWYSAPAGIKTVTLDNTTGGKPGGGSTHNDIAPSFYEIPDVGSSVNYDGDIVSGGKATSCTPPDAVQHFSSKKIVPEIGSSDPSYPNWASALAKIGGGAGSQPTFDDNVHHCSDTVPGVNVTKAASSGNNLEIDYTLTAGTHPLDSGTATGSSTVHVIVNGTEVKTLPAASGSFIANTVCPAGGGTATITVLDSVLYKKSDSKTITGICTTSGGGGGGGGSGGGGGGHGSFWWWPFG